MTGLLNALCCLHAHSLIHGSVSVDSVWVIPQGDEINDNEYVGGVKGLLTEFNFAQPVVCLAVNLGTVQFVLGHAHSL